MICHCEQSDKAIYELKMPYAKIAVIARRVSPKQSTNAKFIALKPLSLRGDAVAVAIYEPKISAQYFCKILKFSPNSKNRSTLNLNGILNFKIQAQILLEILRKIYHKIYRKITRKFQTKSQI
ncbi:MULTISPECIES: hypothetical protein [unclassified Campylobacter]|uniref:hypothetical protein n=1 Tax=unclassified Campylobacter TaxID=2593542 RepID=UPI0022E9D180|nr:MULTISPECIES: hypothetical protein [unclassified Campylobacter]MDA3053923.1 hypothetical protein [Campylobacter sp. VBCF_07 NA4]MDA3060190.1 hypothetical protein [Campylobacter sp. VBCF_02 NA5]MDA3061694.1 hypothetical protein [Campylobacter sp. JMF_14 EL1]MDA3069704.1 hypothetical protein [Campylobacter sp. VBCF_08 NA3]MDA3073200.1 hypothetical protein [Campylobacter sp. JMF_10 EL2]